MKGLILSRSHGRGVVLVEDGEFRHVRLAGSEQVGDEIDVADIVPWRRRVGPFAAAAAVAAAIAITFALPHLQGAYAAPVAYASLDDISGSVVLGLNARGVVVSAHALNADGALLLGNDKVVGTPFVEASESLVTDAFTRSLVPAGMRVVVVMAAYPARSQAVPALLRADVKEAASADAAIVRRHGHEPAVLGLLADTKARQDAAKRHVSVGRLVLQQALSKLQAKAAAHLKTSGPAQKTAGTSAPGSSAVKGQGRSHHAHQHPSTKPHHAHKAAALLPDGTSLQSVVSEMSALMQSDGGSGISILAHQDGNSGSDGNLGGGDGHGHGHGHGHAKQTAAAHKAPEARHTAHGELAAQQDPQGSGDGAAAGVTEVPPAQHAQSGRRHGHDTGDLSQPQTPDKPDQEPPAVTSQSAGQKPSLYSQGQAHKKMRHQHGHRQWPEWLQKLFDVGESDLQN